MLNVIYTVSIMQSVGNKPIILSVVMLSVVAPLFHPIGIYFLLLSLIFHSLLNKIVFNGTARFKNVNNCLNTNIYSYLETSGGQSSNPYLNVVHFLNTRAD